jgi:hypothetical protein
MGEEPHSDPFQRARGQDKPHRQLLKEMNQDLIVDCDPGTNTQEDTGTDHQSGEQKTLGRNGHRLQRSPRVAQRLKSVVPKGFADIERISVGYGRYLEAIPTSAHLP